MSFPGSPADGQVYEKYYWSSAAEVWRLRLYPEIPNPIVTDLTMTSASHGVLELNPIESHITVDLPTPSTVTDVEYDLSNRYSFYELISNGDCESTSSPVIYSESSATLFNATWARDATQKHAETYSYKYTKTSAAATSSYVHLQDNIDTTDLHKFKPGETYTAIAWVYSPTAGGPSSISEVTLKFFEYVSSAWSEIGSDVAATKDAWNRLSTTFTIDAATTGCRLRLEILDTAEQDEFIYVDDIQLFRHYGNGIIDRGDCESVDEPMIAGETTGILTNATWAQSSAQAHNGTNSYKGTIITGGSSSYIYLEDGGDTSTTDLHGLIPEETYTFRSWVYVPTTGGPSPTELGIYFYAYYSAAWNLVGSDIASTQDSWEELTVIGTLPAATTGVYIRYRIDSFASSGEFFYADDVQLFRHHWSGLLDDTGCEITTIPTWATETTTISSSDCTFAQSSTQKYSGTYSFKMTKSVAASTPCYQSLQINETTTDSHGLDLTTEAAYTFSAWVYADTMDVGEAGLKLLYYNDGAWDAITAFAEVTGEWTRVSLSIIIPDTATGIIIRAFGDADASNGEIAYFDDFQIYRHYGATISGIIADGAGTDLVDDGDTITVKSDGEKFFYTKSEIAGKYVNSDGDTMTGELILNENLIVRNEGKIQFGLSDKARIVWNNTDSTIDFIID